MIPSEVVVRSLEFTQILIRLKHEWFRKTNTSLSESSVVRVAQVFASVFFSGSENNSRVNQTFWGFPMIFPMKTSIFHHFPMVFQ